ncbi:hypothetical protein [Bifidobacterium callimiconis]|uniref:Uncharacterized protein n=1 Tax=Bifidobacterium callimiconis TaxID=2306973 RepID=A0A430FBT5_9BIFI|nr:hypothetical protein [Bifidobacterium callimiconis]RSX50258.1 hypothetical protein D2E23_1806 [Bifidobacterium callimiconis]
MTTATLTPENATKAINDIRRDITGRLLSIIRRAQQGEPIAMDELAWAADLITASPSNRDMTILAAIHPDTSDHDLTHIGTHTDERSRTIVDRLMTQAPEHTDALTRTRRLAESMAEATKDTKTSAGPLATAAYLAWTDDDTTNAVRRALEALIIDQTETLPAIILAMIDQHITAGQLER